MKPLTPLVARGFAFLTRTRVRLLSFCIAVLALSVGSGLTLAQTGGGSSNPFGSRRPSFRTRRQHRRRKGGAALRLRRPDAIRGPRP